MLKLQRKKLNETIFNVAKLASFVMVLSYMIVISFPSTPFSILNMKTNNYYVFTSILEKQEEQVVKNNLSLSKTRYLLFNYGFPPCPRISLGFCSV
jgi:hypothetical protein